jgi:formylglycine-generating enzyme required for sulfatase activity
MQPDREHSLSDEATFAGRPRPPRADVSIGDERTLGDGLSAQDTIINDIEVVDLKARYNIEGSLGEGGMGAVVLATDPRLGRKVAIKRILGEAARSKAALARFHTEAKAIAAISHPNVVQIYELGVAKDGPFLVIEYIDGGSLLDHCKAGAIAPNEAVSLICQVCDGLATAHDAGIIHRDIKPANILLTKSGIPKLTDFGLAKAEREAGDRGQTMTGAVMGTPDFMPPEQRRDAALVDHRSDLWSLAATLYQAVSGRSPRVIRLHELPAELQPIIGKGLEDEKDSRYQSVREFRDALRAACEGGPKTIAPAKFEGVLQEGQCKACGTVTSDLTKKFCRSPQCGASLRVACLKCDAQMPVWDGVCGECGGNQPALLVAKRKTLEAKRAKAEALLADLAFDEAIGLASQVSGESRIELVDQVGWVPAFVAAATAERDRQRSAAAERFEDAEKHVAAWDYPAAIQSLEMIPHRLRDEATTSLLSDCQCLREESEKLLTEIASRIGRKEIEGLLPLVERAAGLRGDRADLAKIRQQLTERRDVRLARGRATMAAGDARAAAAALAGADAEDLGPEGGRLLEQVRRAVELEDQLAVVVKDAKADGVVNRTEAAEIRRVGMAYLAVNPRSEKVQSLVEQCERIITPTAFTNSVGIKLRHIPAGRFTRGGFDERPHEVILTKPFYLGVYEVTNAQWKRVMGIAPSKWQDDDRPVEMVSWNDAVGFCRRLSALPEEQAAGLVYRLPTEAEWEYACRAGTTTAFSFGNLESKLGDFAWFSGNSENKTHSVGTRQPNPWGLYDMHGNVLEWCSDWYGPHPDRGTTDPLGPPGGSRRVYRGGSWFTSDESCQLTFRTGLDPSFRSDDLGFRLALSPSEGKPLKAGK